MHSIIIAMLETIFLDTKVFTLTLLITAKKPRKIHMFISGHKLWYNHRNTV